MNTYSQAEMEAVARERVRLWEEEVARRRLLAQTRPSERQRRRPGKRLGGLLQQAWAKLEEWGSWRAQSELRLAAGTVRRVLRQR